ncbi:MAG: hypothetical protein IIB04_03435 [Acidobacteria bacterium]|nr:hypothetical protein [Acidobacteriota bacterium]MCH8985649.1 hypothetical protein [Acidobacteriota bacterium]
MKIRPSLTMWAAIAVAIAAAAYAKRPVRHPDISGTWQPVASAAQRH